MEKEPSGDSPSHHMVCEDVFGFATDPLTKEEKLIRRFTFSNNNRMVVQVITYGATITRMTVPDNRHRYADVVLGFENISDYVQDRKKNPYFGATIGRVANRIANASFYLDGKKIQLTRNHNGQHMLHGGDIGFDSVIWTVDNISRQNCSIRLRHISLEGHEGFPGAVTATIDFKLTENNEFQMVFKANTTRPTPVNLTNHSYFNLAGHSAGREKLLDHYIKINADKITATRKEDLIPTGEFVDVERTPYDFRNMVRLRERVEQRSGEGFDDNFCIIQDPDNAVRVVATAVENSSGRKLEVLSDQIGLQFYTGNGLPDPKSQDRPIVGKDNAAYSQQGAFCFETQAYPDAVNHENFPSIILEPGKMYTHHLTYKFSTITPP